MPTTIGSTSSSNLYPQINGGSLANYYYSTGDDYIIAPGSTINGQGSDYNIYFDLGSQTGSLTNNGLITNALYGVGISTSGSFALVNGVHGEIDGLYTSALVAQVSGPISITNYGTINSNIYPVYGSNSPNSFTNYGTFNGYAYLGDNGNQYKLYTGSFTREIDADGNVGDTITLAVDNRSSVTDPVFGANSGSTTGTITYLYTNSNLTLNVQGGLWHVSSPTFDLSYGNDTLDVTIGGAGAAQHGEIVVDQGDVYLSGANLEISLANGYNPSGQTFTLVENDRGDPVNGQFAQGTTITVGGYVGTINYAGGTSGHDVTVTFASQATGHGIIFEESTQAQAANFASGDALYINKGNASDLHLSYAPASGLTNAAVTLSEGTQSLTFNASALHDSSAAGLVQFLGGSGSLYVASTAGGSYTLVSAKAGVLFGLDGADNFSVSGGNHIVDAGAGTDTITASGTGNMLLAGGAGADTIDASAATGSLHIYGNEQSAVQGAVDGNDVITVGHGAGSAAITDYVNGNAGDDVVTIAGGGTTADVYRLYGGGGNDMISVANESTSAVSSVNGNLGNDTITGGAGQDLLHGGQGDDSIAAGSGNTQMFGDLGNDTLTAGSGIDVMTGGAGNDVFVFGTSTLGAGHLNGAGTAALAGFTDEIVDFTSGQDKIDLARVAAGTAAHLILQSGSSFTSASAAETYAQSLLTGSTTSGAHDVAAIQVGNDTYLFSHENGSGTAIDTVIKLDGVKASALAVGDFI